MGKGKNEISDDWGLGVIEVQKKAPAKKAPERKRPTKEPPEVRVNELAERVFENAMEVENAYISGRVVANLEDESGFVITDDNIGRIIYFDPGREAIDITPRSHPEYFNKPKERRRGR